MTLALTAGLLIGGAVYLFLQREMFRVILGFILLSHGVNLILFAAGGASRRTEPLGGDLDPDVVADPLPQAFVLTAIVIAFSITVVMLVLAVAGRRGDDTHDNVPDHLDDYPDPDVGPAAGRDDAGLVADAGDAGLAADAGHSTVGDSADAGHSTVGDSADAGNSTVGDSADAGNSTLGNSANAGNAADAGDVAATITRGARQ